jgi:hypothetical protein
LKAQSTQRALMEKLITLQQQSHLQLPPSGVPSSAQWLKGKSGLGASSTHNNTAAAAAAHYTAAESTAAAASAHPSAVSRSVPPHNPFAVSLKPSTSLLSSNQFSFVTAQWRAMAAGKGDGKGRTTSAATPATVASIQTKLAVHGAEAPVSGGKGSGSAGNSGSKKRQNGDARAEMSVDPTEEKSANGITAASPAHPAVPAAALRLDERAAKRRKAAIRLAFQQSGGELSIKQDVERRAAARTAQLAGGFMSTPPFPDSAGSASSSQAQSHLTDPSTPLTPPLQLTPPPFSSSLYGAVPAGPVTSPLQHAIATKVTAVALLSTAAPARPRQTVQAVASTSIHPHMQPRPVVVQSSWQQQRAASNTATTQLSKPATVQTSAPLPVPRLAAGFPATATSTSDARVWNAPRSSVPSSSATASLRASSAAVRPAASVSAVPQPEYVAPLAAPPPPAVPAASASSFGLDDDDEEAMMSMLEAMDPIKSEPASPPGWNKAAAAVVPPLQPASLRVAALNAGAPAPAPAPPMGMDPSHSPSRLSASRSPVAYGAAPAAARPPPPPCALLPAGSVAAPFIASSPPSSEFDDDDDEAMASMLEEVEKKRAAQQQCAMPQAQLRHQTHSTAPVSAPVTAPVRPPLPQAMQPAVPTAASPLLRPPIAAAAPAAPMVSFSPQSAFGLDDDDDAFSSMLDAVEKKQATMSAQPCALQLQQASVPIPAPASRPQSSNVALPQFHMPRSSHPAPPQPPMQHRPQPPEQMSRPFPPQHPPVWQKQPQQRPMQGTLGAQPQFHHHPPHPGKVPAWIAVPHQQHAQHSSTNG